MSQVDSQNILQLFFSNYHHGQSTMGNFIITCLSKENEQENTEEKIGTVIDNVWREIDSSINKYQKKYDGLRNNTEKTHGWRVVRLFISSTFADFHAEREVLIKKASMLLW